MLSDAYKLNPASKSGGAGSCVQHYKTDSSISQLSSLCDEQHNMKQ